MIEILVVLGALIVFVAIILGIVAIVEAVADKNNNKEI